MLSLLGFFSSVARADRDEGKLAYEMNCMACHQVDVQVVGPSLVSMAALYPSDKQKEFIAWAKEPGKRDPKLMQMPPMAHVPAETLASIHDFVLEVTKGKEEKNRGDLFQPFKEPQRNLPYVVRAFLPDASPASVAVILMDDLSLCWDTEACRFRYAWKGNKTRLTKWQTVAQLPSKPFYRETSAMLWDFAKGEPPEFSGYRLRPDNSPEFEYAVGGVTIREHIRNGEKRGTLVRSFSLVDPPDEIRVDLGPTGSGTIHADKGELVDGVLFLSGDDAKQFSLTLSRP